MANNGGRQAGGGGNGQMNEHVEFTVKVRIVPYVECLLERNVEFGTGATWDPPLNTECLTFLLCLFPSFLILSIYDFTAILSIRAHLTHKPTNKQ